MGVNLEVVHVIFCISTFLTVQIVPSSKKTDTTLLSEPKWSPVMTKFCPPFFPIFDWGSI